MSKHALNTYLEPEQKVRLERIARRRNVSQATIVREAIQAYVGQHDPDTSTEPSEAIWQRLFAGGYDGPGTPNDHDDIYDAPPARTPVSGRLRRARRVRSSR